MVVVPAVGVAIHRYFIEYGAKYGAAGAFYLPPGLAKLAAAHAVVVDHQHGAIAGFGDLRRVDDDADGR